MSDITLSKSETTLLVAAAGRDGALVLPDSMKPVTRDRLIGRLLRDGLILSDGEAAGHRLTPAGYRAVGLRPPRAKPQDGSAAGEPRLTKVVLIRDLLSRPEGASLVELIAATGWLPHTTRAALSRIRSAGQVLLKNPREDGVTAYRIAIASPVTILPARKRRSAGSEAQAAA